MAPPASRRPGFSRRAQFSIFIGYVLAVFGTLVGALLIVTAHFDPTGHNAIRALLGDMLSPISSSSRAVVRGIAGAGNGIAAYVDAGSKNRALKAELDADRTKLIVANNAMIENAHLRALLHLAQTNTTPQIAAHLISSTGESSRRFAMIDKGALHGVAVGDPVRAADGLVGQISQTGLISSQILLVTDTGNIVPVRRVSDGVSAISSGLGDGRLSVRALAPGGTPFKLRDVFVTSGAGGVYPPGVPVGIVVALDHDIAFLRPFADPNALDFALVQKPFVTPMPTPTQITAKVKKKKRAKDDE